MIRTVLISLFLRLLLAALLAALCGCAVANVGGTVNVITVIKSNDGGDMTSATEPHQSNPSTTTLKPSFGEMP